jgi:hypothetical protein
MSLEITNSRNLGNFVDSKGTVSLHSSGAEVRDMIQG